MRDKKADNDNYDVGKEKTNNYNPDQVQTSSVIPITATEHTFYGTRRLGTRKNNLRGNWNYLGFKLNYRNWNKKNDNHNS